WKSDRLPGWRGPIRSTTTAPRKLVGQDALPALRHPRGIIGSHRTLLCKGSAFSRYSSKWLWLRDYFAGLVSKMFWFRVDVVVHLAGPLQESPQAVAFGPQKLPEFEEADLGHLNAGVRFDAPEQVGATPGGDPVAASRIPEEAQHLSHLALS